MDVDTNLPRLNGASMTRRRKLSQKSLMEEKSIQSIFSTSLLVNPLTIHYLREQKSNLHLINDGLNSLRENPFLITGLILMEPSGAIGFALPPLQHPWPLKVP